MSGRLAKAVPGQPDMWAFVLFEALVFTAYFVVYLTFRTRNPELYLHSQAHLDMRIGVLNTIVLLASSWAVARCAQDTAIGEFEGALRNAYLTAAFGVTFLALKVSEWVGLIRSGYGFSTDEFFQHYFFLTAIHCLHVLIGFVALGVIVYQLRSPQRRSRELVETGATYWHTVDLLWVLIFAMLYVVR